MVLLLGLTVLFTAGAFIWIPLAALALVFLVLAVLWWQKGNTEYEYSYVGGDLRIDRIRNRSKRKPQITLEAEGIRSVMPRKASFSDGRDLNVKDFTSGRKEARVYELIYEKGGQPLKVWIEPDDAMLDMMKLAMPRKITL